MKKKKTPIKIAKGARRPATPFASIEDAIEAFRAGKIIIVVDDEGRENEGDLTIAADKVTPEAINFLARYGRGLICLSMTAERLDELQIPLLVRDNTSRFETAFCTPIDVIGRTTKHRWHLHVQARHVVDEGIGIKLRDFPGGLAGPPRALLHLVLAGIGVGRQVSHIGHVHHMLNLKSLEFQEAF